MRKCDTDVSLGFNVGLFRVSPSYRVHIREEKELSRNVPMHTRGVECMCVCVARATRGKKERRKKKIVIPVRWSGLISEISSVKKFRRVRSPLLSFSLSISLSSQMHMHASILLRVPPSPLIYPPFPPFYRPRGNRQALLTFAIIVLAAASHFYFYLYLRDTRSRAQ